MAVLSAIRSYLTLASDRTEQSGRVLLAADIGMALAGSVVVALMAQVELPFWPVPFTGQTFGVLLVAALLGRVRGSLSLLMYVLGGSAGLPVFAGGSGGLGILLGPTGGYLVGFVAAAWVVGALCERGWASSWGKALATMTIGTLVVFAFGVPRLAAFMGAETAFTLGFVPFLVNDVVKILAVAAVARVVHGGKRA